MKKGLILLVIYITTLSCSSDDNFDYIGYLFKYGDPVPISRNYDLTIEFYSSATWVPVTIRGPFEEPEKTIKNSHIEKITINSTTTKEQRISAICEDKNTLLTIKVTDNKGNLVFNESKYERLIIYISPEGRAYIDPLKGIY